jgi:hypothetical protein
MIVVVALLALVGWVTFNYNGQEASVNFETEKAEQDIDKMSDAARRSADAIQDEFSQDEDVSDEAMEPEPMTTP